jgi:hypothetical protein
MYELNRSALLLRGLKFSPSAFSSALAHECFSGLSFA